MHRSLSDGLKDMDNRWADVDSFHWRKGMARSCRGSGPGRTLLLSCQSRSASRPPNGGQELFRSDECLEPLRPSRVVLAGDVDEECCLASMAIKTFPDQQMKLRYVTR